jgi:phage RecT family recombinase
MANDLAVIDAEFTEVARRFAPVVPPGVNPQQIMTSIVLAIEKTPALLNVNRQSLINAAGAGLVLGVVCDGYSGQGYIIPRKGKAQFQLGVKGIPTIAARGGFVVNRGVILEGDEHEIQLGSGGYVRHKPTPGGRDKRRMVWAYAVASAKGFPDIVDAMDIDEIERIRAMAETQMVWGQHFLEQAKKTVTHRLSKAIPNDLVHKAWAFDFAADQGRAPFFDERAQLHTEDERTDSPFPKEGAAPVPATFAREKLSLYTATGEAKEYDSPQQWTAQALHWISRMTGPQLKTFRNANAKAFEHALAIDPDALKMVTNAIDKRRGELGDQQ